MSVNELMMRRGAMMQSRSGGGGIDWESIAKCMCDSVTTFSIPEEAGLKCSNQMCGYRAGLTSVVIPNSNTSIGQNCFISCTSLASVDIPDTVTSIGNQAFRSCTSLTEVVCRATTPPTLGSNVFQGDSGITIYVPDASVSTYQGTSGWSSWTIKAISERP